MEFSLSMALLYKTWLGNCISEAEQLRFAICACHALSMLQPLLIRSRSMELPIFGFEKFNPHADHAEVLHVQFLEYADSQNRLSDLLHGDAAPLLQWCWVKGKWLGVFQKQLQHMKGAISWTWATWSTTSSKNIILLNVSSLGTGFRYSMLPAPSARNGLMLYTDFHYQVEGGWAPDSVDRLSMVMSSWILQMSEVRVRPRYRLSARCGAVVPTGAEHRLWPSPMAGRNGTRYFFDPFWIYFWVPNLTEIHLKKELPDHTEVDGMKQENRSRSSKSEVEFAQWLD